VGRRDPLLPIAALRAKGLLSEFRMRDLLFTPEETFELLQRMLGRQGTQAMAAEWAQKTEGWVTGLRLAALAMRGRKLSSQQLLRLQGDTRYVMDYLVSEVLGNQPPGILNLLLNTSILDRFCAPLCDELSAPDIAPEVGVIKGADFITWLQANNLFIIALDAENHWFRYHHLFQQLLQIKLKNRFSRKEILALHSWASNWFEKNNLIYEGLKHALAGEAIENAVQMVQRNRQSMIENDQWYVVEKWLSLFPETVIWQQPELLVALVWKLYHHFDISALPPVIDAAESLLEDKPDKVSLHGEFDFFRGYLCYFQNKGARSLKHLREARKKVPETFCEIRSQIEIVHALATQMQGQKKEALGTIQGLIQRQRPAQGVDRTRLLVTPVYINIISGDLEEATSANQQLYTFSVRHGYEYARLWSVYLRGLIRFYQNDLNAAMDDFRLAIEKKFILHTRATVDAMAGLAYAYHATGQPDQADATIQLLTDYAGSLDDPMCSLIARSCKARASISQGKPALVKRWFSGNPPPVENMVWWLEIPSVTHCRALIAEGSEERLGQAEARLKELIKLNQDNHNTCHQIQMMPLLALVYRKQGRTDEALEILEEAVSLSKPGMWIRPFIEAGPSMVNLLMQLRTRKGLASPVEIILAAFKAHAKMPIVQGENGPPADVKWAPSVSTVSQPLVEPLSHRELDVLELLAQRLQSKEIAARLGVSLSTVKTHLRNIYQKLDANSRRTAVEKATALGIIAHR
jgi:LuxR family maltose regulon positive regulatory protein